MHAYNKAERLVPRVHLTPVLTRIHVIYLQSCLPIEQHAHALLAHLSRVCIFCRAWYSGEAYKYGTTYTNWGAGQPDNYGYVQGRSMAFLLDNQNQWDDYYQFMYQEFVCERRLSP